VAFGRFGIFTMSAHLPRRLAPGESIVDRPEWAGQLTGTNDLAPPGRYQIRAVVHLIGVRVNAVVYSGPMAVVITPP
jgi:hypothetical protein